MQIRNDTHAAPEPADLKPLFRMHAELCKALANQYRLGILYALSQKEMCVSDLASALEIPVHNASQHLRVLKDAGLVTDSKSGTRRLYQLNPEGVARLRAHFDQMWTKALSAFQKTAEQGPTGEKDAKPRGRSRRS